MQKVLAAVQLVLGDLKALETPAVATSIAGIAAPIVAAVAGAHITAGELAGWLVIVGGVAATLQKLFSGQAAAALAAKK